MATRPVLVFDVNETLLDLEHLSPFFRSTFGRDAAMREWFAQTILYSQSLALTGQFTPFGELGVAVLDMQATLANLTLNDEQRQQFTTLMRTLPPHADALAALQRLQQHGFRLFTLTNNSTDAQTAQLEKTGLRACFERLFSIEDAVPPACKPAVQTYRQVEQALTLQGAELCLVACHTWDIIGARAAGWHAAMILRQGNATLAAGPQPHYVCEDLHALSDKLIAAYPLNDFSGRL